MSLEARGQNRLEEASLWIGGATKTLAVNVVVKHRVPSNFLRSSSLGMVVILNIDYAFVALHLPVLLIFWNTNKPYIIYITATEQGSKLLFSA